MHYTTCIVLNKFLNTNNLNGEMSGGGICCRLRPNHSYQHRQRTHGHPWIKLRLYKKTLKIRNIAINEPVFCHEKLNLSSVRFCTTFTFSHKLNQLTFVGLQCVTRKTKIMWHCDSFRISITTTLITARNPQKRGHS